MKSLVCSIQRNIRALVAPQHEISMSRTLWAELVIDLEDRGQGVRESGAFLIGSFFQGRREVISYIPYDELEPGCLDAGYINFTSSGYRKLWKILKGNGLRVLGDIHTHPGAAIQSYIDRDNPMMPNAGHMAFILPSYAQGHPTINDVALYIYEGNYCWQKYKPGQARQKLYVGIWS